MQPSALKLTIIAPHIDQGVRAGHSSQFQESLHHILQHTTAFQSSASGANLHLLAFSLVGRLIWGQETCMQADHPDISGQRIPLTFYITYL